MILNAKKVLPEYFQFEGVGILLRDTKDNTLFTIEQTFDDDEEALMKQCQEKKDKKMLLTKEERLLDFERQMKRRNRCVYPTTLGLTGRVFQTGKLVFANDMKQAGGYIPSIDNLSSNVKDVQSILVLPVYG